MSNFDPTAMVEVSEIVLERMKIAASKHIGRDSIEAMRINTRKDFITDSLVIQLQTYVMSHTIVNDSYPVVAKFEFPATAWQHFKRDFMPSWFIERYPVRMKEFTQNHEVAISRKAIYPMSDIGTSNPSMYQRLGSKEIIKDQVAIR